MADVHASVGHTLAKMPLDSIRLVDGLGVVGDAHLGVTVQHRSRVRHDPTQPNLRQVHLIAAELHSELAARGFVVGPGEMGENITTRNVDLLALPEATMLQLGSEAMVVVTGLRNPCAQLDSIQTGLMGAVLARGGDGALLRRAGIMAVVINSGDVTPGDHIRVHLPPEPYRPLTPV